MLGNSHSSSQVLSTSPAPTGVEVSRPRIFFVLERIGEVKGEFHRFASPRTADAILKRLPVHGRAVTYGEQLYFQVGVKAPAENPKNSMDQGAIGYWPSADSVCIFLGKMKPYSPVNVLGRINEGLEIFRNARQGTLIEIRKG
jgi:hypothetical protein